MAIENLGRAYSKISDDTTMWFGVHIGKKMRDIPDSYFQFLLDKGVSFRGIKHYSKVHRKLKRK